LTTSYLLEEDNLLEIINHILTSPNTLSTTLMKLTGQGNQQNVKKTANVLLRQVIINIFNQDDEIIQEYGIPYLLGMLEPIKYPQATFLALVSFLHFPISNREFCSQIINAGVIGLLARVCHVTNDQNTYENSLYFMAKLCAGRAQNYHTFTGPAIPLLCDYIKKGKKFYNQGLRPICHLFSCVNQSIL